MTVEEAKRRVKDIRASSGDPEMAHSLEDELREDALSAIAGYRVADPAVLASAVLESSKIRFPRWCA